jgi:hypothetical protein
VEIFSRPILATLESRNTAISPLAVPPARPLLRRVGGPSLKIKTTFADRKMSAGFRSGAGCIRDIGGVGPKNLKVRYKMTVPGIPRKNRMIALDFLNLGCKISIPPNRF